MSSDTYQVKQIIASPPGWRAAFLDMQQRGQFRLADIALWAHVQDFSWGYPTDAVVGGVPMDGSLVLLLEETVQNFYGYLGPGQQPHWSPEADALWGRVQELLQADPELADMFEGAQPGIAPGETPPSEPGILSVDELNQLWGKDEGTHGPDPRTPER